MSLIIDQAGFRVNISGEPARIISLVPSQTELLYDLGLEEKIIGITKFCVHPEKLFRAKPRIGGTKKLNIEKIRSLSPDLVIANKEENQQDQIELLQKEFPVWTSDIQSMEDALSMIRSLGEITGTRGRAEEIAEGIQLRFDFFRSGSSGVKKTVAYVIWNNPIMVAGTGTFINSMLELNGFKNIITKSRYPVSSMEELKKLKPEFILLSSEPFPFKEKHISFFKNNLPESSIRLVDGEMFSWYGSRLLLAPEYFSGLKKSFYNT